MKPSKTEVLKNTFLNVSEKNSTYTNLFETYEDKKFKMDILTGYCYPAIGGVSAWLYFDNNMSEC